MQRFIVNRFDENTFVVVDRTQQREICICSNYDDWEDAEERARNIVKLLNENNEKTLG